MPTYSFKCNKCYLKFDRSLKISESHSLPCPDCGSSVAKLPAKGVGMKMGAVTSIPKDIDLAVGRDADKKWMEYEDKKSVKDKIRKDSGSERLSVDPDGNYVPFSMTSNGKTVSGSEGAELRGEMFREYMRVKVDPKTKKSIPNREDLSKASSE